MNRLASIFAILGAVAIVAAIGTYLVLGRFDRIELVLVAVGVGLWVYAALEQPQKTAEALSSRNVRYGSNTLVMSLAMIGILVLINVLANRYSDRLDMTQNQIYSLSPLSVQVVKELTQPVHITAFYVTGDSNRQALEDILKEYVRNSNQITYEFVDPQAQPGLAQKYKVQFSGTTVLESGTKQQTVMGSDEGAITSALLKLVRDKPEIAYYLTGHGELDFAGSQQTDALQAKTALEAQNYQMKPLNLASTGKVPDDASLVIVAGPTSPLLAPEVSALESYLDNGGKAIFFVDKRQRPILEPLAEHYGVQIGDGIVIDPALSLMNDPLTPLISSYRASPVTKDLPQLIFQAATAITPMQTPPAGLQIQPLATTSADSWLETDARVVHYDPGVDPKGPLNVMVSVTKSTVPTAPGQSTPTPTASNSMRVVFVGDVAAITNAVISYSSPNSAVLTNAANWLTANEDLIQIQSKVPTDRQLILSNTQLNLLLYGSAIFLPLLVLAGGLFVWWGRR
jgi:ABC-type uncharacterized transport system involved in gliding motility auxiliary subunit